MLSPTHRFLIPVLLATLPLSSCTPSEWLSRSSHAGASSSEAGSTSFVASVRGLRKSKGYRQNCWMIPGNGSDNSFSAALCLDLQDEVYLVVFSDASRRLPDQLPWQLLGCEVKPSRLRSLMHPDASILERRGHPVAGIFRVPEKPEESFGAEAINFLLDRDYQPQDFGFQCD
ncbi:MAG: hypothetical protein EOP88_09175 [Verrucomicrobiaceae bacterium]|nr:MAG: hypothetical protein EOP88_09175 [Verrucomicrobiaceae bacterium]